jgi:hypothetical protein
MSLTHGPSAPSRVANRREEDARPRSDCRFVRLHAGRAAGPGRPGVGAATLRGLEDGGSELKRILQKATGGVLEGGISGLKPLLQRSTLVGIASAATDDGKGARPSTEWRIVSRNSFRPDRYPRKRRRRAKGLSTPSLGTGRHAARQAVAPSGKIRRRGRFSGLPTSRSRTSRCRTDGDAGSSDWERWRWPPAPPGPLQ